MVPSGNDSAQISLDSLPVAVLTILCDRTPPHLHIEHGNDLARTLLGADSPKGLLDRLSLFTSDDGAPSLVDALTDLAASQSNEPISVPVTSPEGMWFVASARITAPDASQDAAGQPARAVLSLIPSAQPRAETTQQQWLAALPEANPNIVIIVGSPNRIEYVNPTGRRWLDQQGADSTDALRALFPRELSDTICDSRGESAREWSTQYAGRDYDVKMTPLADSGRCMLAINDVTEVRALAREHELFAQALQSAKTAMLITDGEGRIEFVNHHFKELYGYSLEEVAGKRPSVLNPGRRIYQELGYSDQQYDELFASMWHDIQDPDIGFWEGELPNQARDGRIVWVRLLVHAVENDRTGERTYLGFPVDISQSRFRERQVRMEIYQAITELAELRDNETGFHIQRVGRYARLIASQLGESRRFQEDILSFAPLHDIGKVGIPDELLLAPRALTADEFAVMKRHAELGYDLLKNKPTMEMAADIAFGHHERWDGTGYPQRIAGEAIPLSARIVSVCDVYDALRSHRPYKLPRSHEASVAAIADGQGTQFDPRVVDAFLTVADQFAEIGRQLPDQAIA